MLLDLRPLFDAEGIRKSLQDALRNLAGLHVPEGIGDVVAPGAIVRRLWGPHFDSQTAQMRYGFEVVLLSSIAGQTLGSQSVSPAVVFDALEQDPTLGGAVDDAYVSEVNEDNIAVYNGLPYFATTVVVTVAAS